MCGWPFLTYMRLLRGVRTALLTPVLAAGLTCGWTTAALAQQSEVLATEMRDTPLASHGDVLVWSSFDATSRRYSLRAYFGGEVEDLPVRPRSVPFDADVGPGPDGKVTVVYSRCRHETPVRGADVQQEALPRNGCRLWRYRLGDRREHLVRRASIRSRFSEFRPSIWGRRIAFARVKDARQRLPELAVRTVGSRRDRRVRLRETRLSDSAATRYVTRLDLRRTRLLSSWAYREAECRDPNSGKVGEDGGEVFAGSIAHQRSLLGGCDLDDPLDVADGRWLGSSISLRITRPGFERRTRLYSGGGELREDKPFPADATGSAPFGGGTFYVRYRPASAPGQAQSAYDIVRAADASKSG